MKKVASSLTVLIIFAFLLASCNLPFFGGGQSLDENAINTLVAQTLAANPALIPPTPEVVVPTVAQIPTITPAPLATVAIPNTPLPTEDTCNRASWVTDVTALDGSIFLPNVAFTKTWRIKNVGSCTWNTNYAVIYSSGDQMSAPAATPLLGSVPPGATVDLSVNMKSPAANGKYKGYFLLRSDTGLVFGTGSTYMYPLYAQIEVSKLMIIPDLDFSGMFELLPLETLVYDFGTNYCIGNWRNATAPGFLACPGAKTDTSGFVVRNDSPKLQNNQTYNGVAILTHPQWIDGGSISGTFPLITVENGMKFRARIGCGYDGLACTVRFFLRYRVEGGTLEQLGQWDVKYTDAPVVLDVDLSSLAGKKINFVLQVATVDSSAQDWAHWVNPRIIK
ncbi:MAG: hypothetical protein C0401_10860 [Anaerolinea sp.]|nr:hypothetical protein [Anaerolinea sp.]